MMDMGRTTKPKTDQLNYDDFIGGAKTITVTDVKIDNKLAQPASIYFKGDDGKPFKPCLSMRRVMVRGWGNDGAKYVGKSMTLYGDPNVTFGRDKVGGIRISHLSHIDKDLVMPLTTKKGHRATYAVKVLKIEVPSTEPLEGAILINNDQIEEIESLMSEFGIGAIDVCQNVGASSIPEMTENQYNSTIKTFDAEKSKREGSRND